MIDLNIQLFGSRGASSSNKGSIERRLKNYKELKKLNSSNVSVGDKLIMRETNYDFKGNVEKEFLSDVEVVRDNKNTFSVRDTTLNMEYKIQKDYEFGKKNLGQSRRFYKKK